jgi:hypothetical protein
MTCAASGESACTDASTATRQNANYATAIIQSSGISFHHGMETVFLCCKRPRLPILKQVGTTPTLASKGADHDA